LEDASPSAQGENAAAHVVRCRRCFALYAEMVRTEVESQVRNDDRTVPPSFLEAAFEIARSGPPGEIAATESVAGSPKSRSQRVVAGAMLAAGLAGILVFATWRATSRSASPAPDPELVRVAESLANRAIPSGWTLDGSVPPAPGSVMRGNDSSNRAIGEIEARLAEIYARSPRGSERVPELLVGVCLAGGNDRHAKAYLEDARPNYPSSRQLAILQAGLDYRHDDLDAAESTLRDLFDRTHDPAAAADLALLLQARGDDAGARKLLQHLSAIRDDDDPLVRYLRTQLE
jgi:hypothetical protein